MSEANRRKYPRANYPCQLTMWTADGCNETILANTSDIGLEGLCVRLNRGIDLGMKVDIILNFESPTPPLKCRGEVVRSHKESEQFYNIGIHLELLSEEKRAFLNGKISELINLEQKGKS